MIDQKQVFDVPASDLHNLAGEHLRFTQNFFHLIQQSAPHIYHSALPLSPRSSMFHSMTPRETLVTGLYGCPDTWGAVIQTIQGSSDGFTCITAFSDRIAVACSDGGVRIYDVATGALKVSLKTIRPVKAMRGLQDGSLLFCVYQEHSIALWDIQTGGLIRQFALAGEVQDIAVSSKGRFLACGLPNGFVQVLEVMGELQIADIRVVSRVRHFCWLGREEQLMIMGRRTVHTWDIAAGTILPSFKTVDLISDVVHSQELNRLAIITKSPLGDTVIIIDPQTSTSSVLSRVQEELSCFTFFRTTGELMCGTGNGGLEVFNFSTWSWRSLKYPEKMTFVCSLPNGTVVAGFVRSGIQLLSLDDGYSSSPRLASALDTNSFDQGRIIAIIPTTHSHIQLLETSTLSKLGTIHSQGTFSYPFEDTHSTPPQEALPLYPGPTNYKQLLRSLRSPSSPPIIHLPIILYASLKNRIAVHCFEERGNVHLALCEFGDEPKWTVAMDRPPSIGRISPAGTRLVTFHSEGRTTRTCVWDTKNGQLQAQLLNSSDSLPSDITFESETRFYSHHDDCRVPYDINPSPDASTTCLIKVRHEQEPWTVRSSERGYKVDSRCEWVVSGSERICWIPPGYIRLTNNGYCWAKTDTLVMVGEDGTLRKLTFRLQKPCL